MTDKDFVNTLLVNALTLWVCTLFLIAFGYL